MSILRVSARPEMRVTQQLSRCRTLHTQPIPRPSSRFLKISEEVRDAVATGKPVVALETTIYTHGFPYPDNVALAKRLEAVVRATGGVPATIGVLNGIARVGMNAAELNELTSASQHKNVLKVSRRDLGYICGAGLAGKRIHGGTTIAGTMILARLAGIKVFATGGLGGVHRGGESSLDISADLTELGRTPVAVVSSGCKSFLDIQRTLEYLETEGVVVGTFADGREGRVDFPAFYTRDSGIKAPRTIRDAAEAAAIIYAQSQLQLSSGMLFTNPVPEKHSLPKPEMDAIIAKAVELSHIEGAQGSDNTPYVLAKIEELSGGRSVAANRALVECNVELGTKVAIELAALESGRPVEMDRHMPFIPEIQQESAEKPSSDDANLHIHIAEETPKNPEKIDILVAGSLAVDLACDYTPLSSGSTSPALHTSNPASISQSLGGVGYNVALAANYLGSSVLFCSVVADDLSGRAALTTIKKKCNLPSHGIQILPPGPDARTAQYIAINDAKKDLVLAMADMSILELPDSKLQFSSFWEPLLTSSKPTWAVVDTNWGPSALSSWIKLCRSCGVKIAVEPVSAPKSTRLFSSKRGADEGENGVALLDASTVAPHNHLVDLITPNQHELASMHAVARETGLFDSPAWWEVINSFSLPSAGSRDRFAALTSAELVDGGVPQMSIQLLPYIPCIVTKLGGRGVLVTQMLKAEDERLKDPEYARYILSRNGGDGEGAGAGVGGVYMRLFPAAEKLSAGDVVSVNGAGDTLLGVLVSALARGTERGKEVRVEEVIPIAQRACIQTLRSKGGVSPDIADVAPLLERL